jgi:hypothetical protein
MGVVSFMRNLIFKRNNYKPSVKKIIDKYGMYRIVTIEICRKQLNGILNETAKLFATKDKYDTYFHIFLLITLANGKSLRVEKNSTIEISEIIPECEETDETFNLIVIRQPTLYDFMENSRKKHKDFFMYKADSNNCQNFILNLLIDSNLNTFDSQNFILQDVDDIFKNNEILRKFVNSVTDLSARIDVLKNHDKLRR